MSYEKLGSRVLQHTEVWTGHSLVSKARGDSMSYRDVPHSVTMPVQVRVDRGGLLLQRGEINEKNAQLVAATGARKFLRRLCGCGRRIRSPFS